MYRSLAATIATVLVCAFTLQAAEVPDHLKAQVKKVRQLCEQQLVNLEKRMEDLQSELKTARRDANKRRDLMQEIDRTKKEIQSLKDGALPSTHLNHFKLAIGQVGTIGADLEVLNVLGPEKILVAPYFLIREGVKEPQGEPFMIYGYPTQGVVDGQTLRRAGVFEVTGTEQYTTVAGGAKTVFKITWYDADTLKPYLDKQAARLDRPDADQTRPVRTWTDASGKFSVKASFAGSALGKVRLRKEDGSVIEVDLDKLSADDRKYINGLR